MSGLSCPACGAAVAEDAPVCPKCRLAGNLFDPVREAASPLAEADPVSLRTIGEILASVDLSKPAPPPTGAPPALLARVARFPAMPAPSITPRDVPPAPAPLREFPELPPVSTEAELEHRLEEYLHLGRRLGLDFTAFESRANEANLVHDPASLESVVREMFVHVTSALSEEYETALARRNELAAFSPVQPVDAALEGARQALERRDLSGAQRRLALVRDELHQTEEEWAVGRILVTEGDLLAATLRELGGDPAPALGPFEEGRRLIRAGRRTDGERLLARGAIALWALLEPKLLEDLHRLRDRLVELRGSGVAIQAPVEEIKTVLAELRQRNFVGTIVAYRHVRTFVEEQGSAGDDLPSAPLLAGGARHSPGF